MRAIFRSRRARVTQTVFTSALCAAAIAGCGAAGSDAPSGSSAAPAADSSVGWAPSPLTSESATEILQKSAAAVAKVKTFRMQGTISDASDSGKWTKLSMDVYSAHLFLISAELSRGGISMILSGRRAYFRADDKFMSFETHGAAAAPLFANRWFTYPSSEARKLTRGMDTGLTTPAKCMLQGNGALSLAGYTMVGNQRAILIRGTANEPGEQSSLIAVALYGPPYPLKVTAEGKPLPGHYKAEAGCSNSSGPAQVGSFRLSDFDSLPKLEIPVGATSLQQYAEELRSRAQSV